MKIKKKFILKIKNKKKTIEIIFEIILKYIYSLKKNKN
jgi:hypothetical protein